MTQTDGNARKRRSIAILEANGVTDIADPIAAAVDGRQIRSGEEIARRAMCLSVVSELALCGGGTGARNRLAVWELESGLTAREAAFLSAGPPSEHERIRMTWRYEALVPLMWAIGLIAALPFPRDTFDPRLLLDFWRTVGRTYWRGAETRDAAEILDETDLIHRLEAAVREAERRGDPAPAGLIAGVVAERRHALDWLTGDGPWDDVSDKA